MNTNVCNYTDLEFKKEKLLEIGKCFYFNGYGATDILKDFSL